MPPCYLITFHSQKDAINPVRIEVESLMTPLSPKIPEVLLLEPKRFGDERGFFSEVFSQRWFEAHGLEIGFVQDNHALSGKAGVIRGLHFQFGTAPQAKLVRCSSGAILDVAVDIRHGSPTFGHYVSVELSAENWRQVLIPPGFAHGYCTLTEQSEVQYKVDHYYDPDQEAGIRWNDPALGITWPVGEDKAELSAKDKAAPVLADCPAYFEYKKGHGPFNVVCLSGEE